ncbi:Glycosyltransferase, catalytic subunit of cellulose synthase and poly-beta-1,6-N-acetylglucosamine synthase [Filimonas lacunae]|uniref:Glycosyltransferase, catalytic subunit of cellulose synthase and poly-beta-1,6-N-acetylglucosamine synthase n=1 Tax=Filimonas lacunae TaxID=477680 RepID=A0A173MRG7_9BACT|nr:glycosyltransferase family 2 protein [Filimonas lacunae]BAV10242.1 glycosyl transferase, group 2 family protein [Filimonas lacunae]SIT17894.1 Glycosyltransferase, catalytic subunit of cellulose synthase and poly-beta-1,6-N-acetylglucosamine synthase [Filimonas lacunae]
MYPLFWISLFIIFYAFIGYGIVLYIFMRIRIAIKGRRNKGLSEAVTEWPTVTLIVAAYNEAAYIEEKIANTLQLDYPADKIQFLFVTDGSTDETPAMIAKHSQITLMHQPARNGKIAAVHRAMQQVTTEIVVFTDANTALNKQAIKKICRHYQDARVGAVSGEKRVQIDEVSDATAGEGVYWKYESKLKAWDSELYSVVGAAGELFSVKTALYEPVPSDSILDDFMISLLIAQKGYRIVYEPDAYASESSSASIEEELKRKVRISAGGIQSISRLTALLNPFKFPVLSFQYISHRVLRWTVVPFLMLLVFLLNIALVAMGATGIYLLLLVLQVLFYGAALLGWILEKKQLRMKLLFIPFYFCMMNYAVIAGIRRYYSGNQSAAWEKAKRK